MTETAAQPTLDTRASVREAVAAVLDTQGAETRVLDLAAISGFTDWFVVTTARNERQVVAIADRVEERLRENGVRPLHVEGQAGAQWVLLDYGDMLVHVFLEERRGYYGLERLWRDAPDRTDEFLP